MKMHKVVINGQVIQCSDGNISITARNGITTITVDGDNVVIGDRKDLEVRVDGNCGNITCNGNVSVTGNVLGNVECDGSCHCGDVTGNVEADGSVIAHNVQGSVNADGNVIIGRR